MEAPAVVEVPAVAEVPAVVEAPVAVEAPVVESVVETPVIVEIVSEPVVSEAPVVVSSGIESIPNPTSVLVVETAPENKTLPELTTLIIPAESKTDEIREVPKEFKLVTNSVIDALVAKGYFKAR